MTHPVEDPFRAAARHAIDGDLAQMFNAIRDTWIDRCVDDFVPEEDADEDGPYSDPRGDMHRRCDAQTDGYLDQEIGDAVYELLVAEVGEDEAVRRANDLSLQIQQELVKHVDEITDAAFDAWSDGASYASDPYRYHGVSRRDFF